MAFGTLIAGPVMEVRFVIWRLLLGCGCGGMALVRISRKLRVVVRDGGNSFGIIWREFGVEFLRDFWWLFCGS